MLGNVYTEYNLQTSISWSGSRTLHSGHYSQEAGTKRAEQSGAEVVGPTVGLKFAG
jgi:hypothetical protein